MPEEPAVFTEGRAESCPDCGGDLCYPVKGVVVCESCESEFAHASTPLDGETVHQLRRFDDQELGEVVAEDREVPA